MRSCPIATTRSAELPDGRGRRHVEPAPRGAVARALSAARDRAAARQRQHAAAQARRGPVRRDHPRRRGSEAAGLRRAHPRAARARRQPAGAGPGRARDRMPHRSPRRRSPRSRRSPIVGTTLATTAERAFSRALSRQLPHAARRVRRMGGGRAVAARPARDARRHATCCAASAKPKSATPRRPRRSGRELADDFLARGAARFIAAA